MSNSRVSTQEVNMTAKERREWKRLQRLWATSTATKAQMLRCMELDRKAAAAHRAVERAPLKPSTVQFAQCFVG